MFKWPLVVGQKWNSEWLLKNQQCGFLNRKFDAEVKSFGKVKTPAGEFDAFLVEHSGYYSFDRPTIECQNGTMVLSYWYSPEVKRIVRFEQRMGGAGGTWNYARQELTAYKVKQ